MHALSPQCCIRSPWNQLSRNTIGRWNACRRHHIDGGSALGNLKVQPTSLNQGTWPKQASTQQKQQAMLCVIFCSDIMHACMCFVLLSRPHAWCKGRVEFTRIIFFAFSTSVCTCAGCPFAATWILMQLYVDARATPLAHTHMPHRLRPIRMAHHDHTYPNISCMHVCRVWLHGWDVDNMKDCTGPRPCYLHAICLHDMHAYCFGLTKVFYFPAFLAASFADSSSMPSFLAATLARW